MTDADTSLRYCHPRNRPHGHPPSAPRKTGALTSTSIPGKTRRCQDCGSRKHLTAFPRDKHGRPDSRMCVQCVDENAPQLMTENQLARWLGVTIAEVRQMEPAGDYSPPRGQTVPLYGRQPVSVEHLPIGWREVFRADS